jgi:hypothetical protein
VRHSVQRTRGRTRSPASRLYQGFAAYAGTHLYTVLLCVISLSHFTTTSQPTIRRWWRSIKFHSTFSFSNFNWPTSSCHHLTFLHESVVTSEAERSFGNSMVQKEEMRKSEDCSHSLSFLCLWGSQLKRTAKVNCNVRVPPERQREQREPVTCVACLLLRDEAEEA